ncbi:hypothetical protein F4802DRAFT_555040 [Xylaria palmicola]|nr:hypothetical protein F4802DRAFT_555040 [Xylaria palmicola]
MARRKGAKKGVVLVSDPSEDTTVNSPLTMSTVDKSISTTTSGFAIRALRNGILDHLSSKTPSNIKAIRRQHARSRGTASPPEIKFERYARRVLMASNESTMVHVVGNHMLKEYDDDNYQKSFNQQFTAFPRDVGLNNGLSAPQPDLAEGLLMREYGRFPVEEDVKGAVLYKDNLNSLTLPHLAGELKARGGNMEKAMLQGRYDGAALVYARNQALEHIGKPDPPGHAEVRTFTTDGTTVNFYAHYAEESKDTGMVEYHQYRYASANVIDTYKGHKEGYRGIRNQQDHAKVKSYDLRDQLKTHWKRRRSNPLPTTEGASSHDGDGDNDQTPAQEGNTCPNTMSSPVPDKRDASDPRARRIVGKPRQSINFARSKRTTQKDPPSSTMREAQAPLQSSQLRRSARLSKVCQLEA